MKTQGRAHGVVVRIVDDITLNAREAGFLRVMAKHCNATLMPGWQACLDLIEALDAARIPEYPEGPTCGLFEEDP